MYGAPRKIRASMFPMNDFESKKQVDKAYYFSKKYTTLDRFISYFYQIDTIRNEAPESVLFVGVGDGVVPDFLKNNSTIKVTTLDIAADLEPDIVGDVRSIPMEDGAFDYVCAFQILEHLPFAEQENIFKEFHRVAKKGIIISVPHRRVGLELILKVPFIRTLFKRDFLRAALLVPTRFPGYEISGQHYWEIDGRTTKLSAYRAEIERYFKITREVTAPLDPYRRFFIAHKKDVGGEATS